MTAVATQEDYVIELIDESLKTRALLDMAHGVAYPLGLFGYGRVGGLALHIDSAPAQMVFGESGDWFVRIRRKGEYLRTFKVEKDDYGYEAVLDREDDYLALTLQPAEWVFKDVYGQKDIAGAADVFESPNLSYDDVVLWVVDHACGPNAYTSPTVQSRVIPGLTISAAVSAHPTSGIVKTANRKQIWEWLNFFCPAYDIDFSLDLVQTVDDDNEWVFSVYYPRRGLDRSEGNGARRPVIINDGSLNIVSGRRFRERGFYNVVVNQTMTTELIDAASVAANGRKEMLATVNDTNDLTALAEEFGMRTGYEYVYAETDNCQIIDHFGPGDLVTTNNFRMDDPASDLVVKELFVTLTKEGNENVELVFGDYDKPLDSNDGGGGASRPMDTFWEPLIEPVAGTGIEGVRFAIPKGDHQHRFVINAAAFDVPPDALGAIQFTSAGGSITLSTGATSVNFEVAPGFASLWYEDLVGTPFLRPLTLGHAVQVHTAGGGLAFHITGDGDVYGNTLGVAGSRIMDINDYDMVAVGGGGPGVHDVGISGDVFSYGSGSKLQWTQTGDVIYGRTIMTIDQFDPAGATTGWSVDEDGNSFWKVAAELTLEGLAYRFPTAAPAASDYKLGYDGGAAPYRLEWQAPTVTDIGPGTAQYQVPMTGSITFEPAWTNLSSMAGAGLTFAAGHFDVGAGTGITVNADNVAIANTAVAPAAYGDATHVATFTVDQQGRLTAAAEVVVSGVVPSAHDIVGGLHTVAGAIYQVVGLTAANTIGLLTPTVVGAANSVVRTDASGYITAKRFYWDNHVLTGTSYLGLYTSDAYILFFANSAARWRIDSTSFQPEATDTYSIGAAGKRPSTIYGVAGNFSGDVTIGTAAKGIIMDSNTNGKIIMADGTRFVEETPEMTGHVGGYRPNSNSAVVNSSAYGAGAHLWIRTSTDGLGGGLAWTQMYAKSGEHNHNALTGQNGAAAGNLALTHA